MDVLNPITRVTVRGYNGVGQGSAFIRWFTFGKYSHVSLVFWFRGGTSEEWEALQKKKLEPHKMRLDFDKEYTVPLTPCQMIEAHLIYQQVRGSEYDWTGIFGLLKRVCNNDPDKWFCSELVAYVLLKVGYPLSRREPFRETPTSVMESLKLLDKDN